MTADHGEVGGLARAAAGGDAAAWEALVRRFSGLVWAVARRYHLSPADAADVFQTTWLRLAEHVGRLENPEGVGAWLATTARRESLRTARGITRTIPADEEALAGLAPADDGSPEQAVLKSEQAVLDARRSRQLWRAFQELPVRCRDLLRVLMATPPPSYAEAAAALGLPVGSLGPTRARCLRQLRGKLVGKVSEPASRAHEDE